MEFLIPFIFGVLIGSFLNVVILRLPKDESVVFGSSHCPTCKNELKPWHNIPLFSWLFLRGKCAFCNTKISPQYPMVELLSGLIFLTLSMKFGFNAPMILIAFSFLTLLALSMIDFRYKMVPDSLNLLALTFAIFGAWNLSGIATNFQNALLFGGGFTLLRFAISYMLTSSAHRHAKKNNHILDKKLSYLPFHRGYGRR